MIILITGANGYVGRNLIPLLINKKYTVHVLTRDKSKLKKFRWHKDITIHECDFYNNNLDYLPINLKKIDCFIHLSWMNLPNYDDDIHVKNNLPKEKNFLIKVLKLEIKKILITGTCLEYGHVDGAVSEDDKTIPISQYGIAKDKLRIFLESQLKLKPDISLSWLRLFYVYGNDQPERYILPQLEKAISNNDKVFKMSHGNQIRDFIHISEVVNKIIYIVEKNLVGIINISSGIPQSLFYFVNKRRIELKSSIKLQRGFFDSPEYEPEKIWGISKYF
jgi:nucleoside-diphosphate-sugar epimerase